MHAELSGNLRPMNSPRPFKNRRFPAPVASGVLACSLVLLSAGAWRHVRGSAHGRMRRGRRQRHAPILATRKESDGTQVTRLLLSFSLLGVLLCLPPIARRGIIMSVLASRSKRLERFTLGNVLSEIDRWLETGRSVFQEELAALHHATGPLCAVSPYLRGM